MSLDMFAAPHLKGATPGQLESAMLKAWPAAQAYVSRVPVPPARVYGEGVEWRPAIFAGMAGIDAGAGTLVPVSGEVNSAAFWACLQSGKELFALREIGPCCVEVRFTTRILYTLEWRDDALA